jgi:hypothetical protein
MRKRGLLTLLNGGEMQLAGYSAWRMRCQSCQSQTRLGIAEVAHPRRVNGREIGCIGLELRNLAANQPFERSRRRAWDKCATETRLRGWACETRTLKRRRKLSL